MQRTISRVAATAKIANSDSTIIISMSINPRCERSFFIEELLPRGVWWVVSREPAQSDLIADDSLSPQCVPIGIRLEWNDRAMSAVSNAHRTVLQESFVPSAFGPRLLPPLELRADAPPAHGLLASGESSRR